MKALFSKFFLLITLMTSITGVNAQDSIVMGLIQHHVGTSGNSGAPVSLTPASYPNGVDKCHSTQQPSDGNCPSDLLYTPNANTGGYQSFGVGLTNYLGGTYYYPYCYINWTYDGEGSYYPYISCIYYVFNVVDHAVGSAAAHIVFGSNNMSSPWGNKPMSTMAFKANQIYTPVQQSVECTPDQSQIFSAPCLNSQQNVYAVPINGYEDKVIISDHGCDMPLVQIPPNLPNRRTGSATDAQYNCFVKDGTWATNLPSPYPDTTYLDEEGQFQPAMGSAEPDQIIEGASYAWYYDFYQLGLELGTQGSWQIQHNSAVTTFKNVSLLNCTSSSMWDCYFTVDQVRIAPYANL